MEFQAFVRDAQTAGKAETGIGSCGQALRGKLLELPLQEFQAVLHALPSQLGQE